MTAMHTHAMNDPRITVLLVGDDRADAGQMQDARAGTGEYTFHVEWVMRLDDAPERLDREGIGMIQLDLTLPDGQDLDVFHQVLKAAPNTLILVPSAARDEEIARLATRFAVCKFEPLLVTGVQIPHRGSDHARSLPDTNESVRDKFARRGNERGNSNRTS
jgi:DNA-binding NtrC family response regulator